MIAYLKGSVLAVTAESAIIENNGVGYEVFCSGSAFAAVQAHPQEVALFTYLQVKEDGLTLYGFTSLKEKQLFLDLISVSGVGPKLGIGVLNGMQADDVARAIATADVKMLSRVKGLGKKTAEKIVLELHGKVSASELLAANGENGANGAKVAPMPAISRADEEAIGALMGLGFTRNECQTAIARAHEKGAESVEDIIRLALANL
jgi:Holliday junction DNA helicase RuvA